MTDELSFYLYRHGTPDRLRDGTPFYSTARVGVGRAGWPDLGIVVGIQDGRPVLNRVVIERARGPLARCSSPRCDYSETPISPALHPPAFLTTCPKCGKGTLQDVPSSVGPDGEVFTGAEFGASVLRGIPWDRVVTGVTAAIAYAAARETADADPGAAAQAALGARRRRAQTDDLLERVAAVVRANPDAPTRAVSEQLHTSYRNASRWISEAKRRHPFDGPQGQ